MIKRAGFKHTNLISSFMRGIVSLTFLFLVIEFFDELNYGIGNAVLPALRTDLGLTYIQVGLLLGVPGIANTFIEPVLMLLGDTRLRKAIMIGGGLAIVLSLVMIAITWSFPVMLIAMVIGYPASGAFVSLSQATLMDLNPGREPHMMARWTVAGSVANLIGPLILSAGFAFGIGWRWAFYGLGVICAILVGITWLRHIPVHQEQQAVHQSENVRKTLLEGVRDAVRNPLLMRWMVLLQFSDLLLDVLTGYLALYFTDVIGLSIAQASLMLSVLMLAGLISNIVLIPLLEKYPGRNLVRLSAGVTGILYAAWLLAPWLWAKIGLIIVIKLVTIGWYEVLQGEAFASVPGKSGTVMAINSVIGVLGGGISFFIGWVAAQAGLPAAMWLLLAGPVILVLFVPQSKPKKKAGEEEGETPV